jgi:hypothetical protein
MVGVPVLNENLSCPSILEQQGCCKVQMFNVQGEQTPAQSFKNVWGVDISGSLESDAITGIYADADLTHTSERN